MSTAEGLGTAAISTSSTPAPGKQRATLMLAWLGGLAARVLHRHAGFLTLIAAHLACAVCVAALVGQPYHSGMVDNGLAIALVMMPVFLCALLIWRCGVIAFSIRPKRPLVRLWQDIKEVVCDADRLAGGLVVLIGLVVFMGSFAFLKQMIPYLKPFAWDERFMRLDLLLHAGRQPFEIMWPLLGKPAATTVVNFLYHLWFFVLFCVAFAAAFAAPRSELRIIFLHAFVLTWAIGGNVLATIFSSAGPVYYERLGLGSEFSPLMTSLRAFSEVVPVWALHVQEALWTSYSGSDAGIAGISAMPSMHVATAVLCALYGFGISRFVGWLLAAFAASVQIGSVHLGWHYAIDGYFGALVAVAAWWAAAGLQRGTWSTLPSWLRRLKPPAPAIRG